jgi:NAD(P)-dependent dehydrogenase (short-subunit alcohol dehydrogenase family)
MVNNKVIIVTGTGSGIGKACAKVLLQNKAKVIGFDLQPGSIKNDQYEHHIVDVREETGVIDAVSDVAAKHSGIDGLINCAGIFASRKPFLEISLSDWDKVISTNLTGTFLISKYVGQRMIEKQKGRIVNISCIRSRVANENMAEYAASKGGVVALTTAMAVDLAKYNIQVNSIAPGTTYSGITEKKIQ